MDNSIPSSSSSLFNIPQLAENGSNWVTYKHRMTIALGVHGLGEYVDGTAIRPILITTATSPSGITAVNVEYEYRLLCNPQSARKGGNATLHTGNSTRQG
jgi:hypothetical protein